MAPERIMGQYRGRLHVMGSSCCMMWLTFHHPTNAANLRSLHDIRVYSTLRSFRPKRSSCPERGGTLNGAQ